MEVNSFLWKLFQLNSCGFNATLHFSTYEGRIYANMNADLGFPLHAWTDFEGSRRNTFNPSRIRRRTRRRKRQPNPIKDVSAVITVPNVDSAEASSPSLAPSTDVVDTDLSSLSLEPSTVNQLSDDEESLPDPNWTWTEPTEEDILEYMRNFPQNFKQEPFNSVPFNSNMLHESQDNMLTTNTRTSRDVVNQPQHSLNL